MSKKVRDRRPCIIWNEADLLTHDMLDSIGQVFEFKDQGEQVSVEQPDGGLAMYDKKHGHLTFYCSGTARRELVKQIKGQDSGEGIGSL